MWRQNGETWLLTPVETEPSPEDVARLSDMLTDEERGVIRAAVGAVTFDDVLGLMGRSTCNLCLTPASLRDPRLPWPDCEPLHRATA